MYFFDSRGKRKYNSVAASKLAMGAVRSSESDYPNIYALNADECMFACLLI